MENAYITAQLSNSSFQLRHITRFDGIIGLIDTPRHTIQGFIVNIACDNFLNIFTQVCFRTCAKYFEASLAVFERIFFQLFSGRFTNYLQR